MNIQLLYVKNVISRIHGVAQQELVFVMQVKNLAYQKQVEARWMAENGTWHHSPASYLYTMGNNDEVWQAEATYLVSAEGSLPGNIQFALRYQADGKEYWDSDNGHNYHMEADAGIQLGPQVSLLNLEYHPELQRFQKFYPITVAVKNELQPKQVYVRWSTNHWHSYERTACSFRRDLWDKAHHSNARNPNRYGCGIWTARLPIGGAYQIDYTIECERPYETSWDSNLNKNYGANRGRLKVLTLNLHCYQEEHQNAKFSQIARAINDLDIDIVCLQEVAEHWNNGQGDWNSNAAKVIRDRLKTYYHLHTNWSHLGFDKYREGVAILSKYPFTMTDSGYVSDSQDPFNIHARRVVLGQVNVPFIGLINVFSCHLSWWHDGFAHQFDKLRDWANKNHGHDIAATFLCGDFNIKAGAQGYQKVVTSSDFEDQYLKANERDRFNKVFRHRGHNWQQELDHDGRIDYLFLKKNSRLQALAGQELFTDQKYGRVSDHLGYYVEFAPR